jgi:transmembrane sensor
MKGQFSHPDDAELARIRDEAAAWLARHDRGWSASDRAQFLRWLEADPRHEKAWRDTQYTWTALGRLAELPLPELTQPPPARARRRKVRVLAWIGVAMATAAAVAVGWVQWSPALRPAATTGSLRVIPGAERQMLPDGSVATLRDGARIATDYTPSARQVRLLEGELFVQVTKDPARPFFVEVNDVAVRAVGTAFNVHRTPDAVEVLVSEGVVRIEGAANSGRSVVTTAVAAGQRATFQLGAGRIEPEVGPIEASEIERRLSWQSTWLEFDSLPLAAVAAEFNLRGTDRLTVADAETAALRVSGTFRANELDGFVRLLQAGYGLQVERGDDGAWVVRGQRAPR